MLCYIANICYIAIFRNKESTAMHVSNNNLSTQRSDQVFMFSIRSDKLIRATVTIFAEDLDGAWSRVHALFPGWDLSDTDVHQTG